MSHKTYGSFSQFWVLILRITHPLNHHGLILRCMVNGSKLLEYSSSDYSRFGVMEGVPFNLCVCCRSWCLSKHYKLQQIVQCSKDRDTHKSIMSLSRSLPWMDLVNYAPQGLGVTGNCTLITCRNEFVVIFVMNGSCELCPKGEVWLVIGHQWHSAKAY